MTAAGTGFSSRSTPASDAATAASACAHPFLSERVAALTTQIAVSPDDASLRIRRGDHFRLEGQHWLALADYVKARQLAPGLEAIDFSIGELMLAAERPQRSLVYLDRFLAGSANHPGALLARARALVAAHRPNDALAAYELALEHLHHPRPDHYLELTRLHDRLGQPAQAVATAEEGCRRLGHSTALEAAALEIEIAQASWPDALARLASLSPRREHWLTYAAELHETLGNFELARKTFLDARQRLAARPSARRRLPALTQIATRIDLGLDRLDQMATSLDSSRR